MKGTKIKTLGKAHKQIMGHTEKAATEELENQANPMSYKSEEFRWRSLEKCMVIYQLDYKKEEI